jgi:hypothetical protein
MAENPNPENVKTCLECGELLGPGREDRKFCNDICRTAYNNRRRKEPPPLPRVADPEERYEQSTLNAIKNIQDILFRNRVQLLNMYGLYENMIGLNDFYGFGINLKYFTSEYKDDNGRTYRMCFDYGYRIEGEHVYLVYSGAEIHFN